MPSATAHALHAIRSERRVWSTMGDSQPPAADVEATRMAENGGWGWTIRAAGGQQIIGSVSLFPGDEVSRSLTWYLHPDHWGHGLASEAVSAVVDHLLGTAGFARLDAWIDHTNRRLIGVRAQRRDDRAGPHGLATRPFRRGSSTTS